MRIVTESDQCVCPKSDEEAVKSRVPVLNFSLEGKSIHLEPRVREDPHKKNQKSSSPQQLRIDLQREQGIQLPKKPGRARKNKGPQRRLSDPRKSARELVLTRRPSVAPRTSIPPRTPLVISKMSMPTEGQQFSDNSVVANTSEEASNVVKRLMGTNSVVEESTSTKKVSKQTAVKGNVSSIRGQVLQQQNSLEKVQESNNNKALSEINSNNQVVNTSQKTVSSTSSTTSTKTTRRESYSTQTHVQESFSSSYEDVEDNSGVAAICSPEQIKAATNVSKTSKTSKQVKEVRQSTLQSTSSIDSDISSIDDKKVKKDAQTSQQVQTVDTQQTKDTEKVVAENVDYTEQTTKMSVEEFQKIRTIKEFIHVHKKLKNAEDNDTEEEEEEDYESEKIMSVDDIRKRLAANPPKEVINDATKNEQIIKGSRIEEIRTTTKTIYPNPDNGDQPVEQETITVERKVVPAGTTIMSNTESTQKTVVATQETAVKKTKKSESKQVKETKTKTNQTGTQEVVQQDTAVQNVQNVNKQNVQAVQNVQTENVQQTVQNVQTQNVQQTVQNVQTQNVQQNTQKVVETQNAQQKVQDVQAQNVSKNVQENTQNIQTQNVQQNTQNVNTQQTKTTDQNTTQNTDKSQQTKSMTLEEFQNIRKIKEYITTERKMLNPEDDFVEEEGETSFEAEIILTLDEIRKRIATKPPKETVKDTTKNAPIPPGSKILEIRTITKTVLPNPDKNDEKVEQVTVLLERTVVPAGTPLIPNAENIPQKKVVTAGQETAVKKTTSTDSQQVQQTKTQITQTGTTDTQNVAQNKNVQNVQTNTQNIQNTQNQQNIQNSQNVQNIQNTQNVQSNIQNTNIQETQNIQRNITESQNVQSTQNVQNTQNEALKSSVNTIKKTSTLTSTSSIDSDTSSLDEASRLNQNNQLVDSNQGVGGSSVVKQTSSKTSKVTETRKITKHSSSGAPETHVEEASKTQSSETVVNATCGADGKFNVEENTKSSTTVSSGVGNDEEMKRQIQSQNKNLTKKLVSDGKTVVADVDQFKEKVVQQQEGDNVTFKQTTSDSKHKRMVEDASKFEQPALALAALPSPDSQPGSASPQIEMPSFQQNK